MRRRDALPDPEVDRRLRELDAALAADPTADPDLLLLVADVRAARPEPSAAFLASLDARVHAGFPREDERPTKTPWHVRLRQPHILAPGFGLAAVVALVVLVASGGGTHDGDSASSSSGSGSVASAPTRTPEAAIAGGASSADSASSSGSTSSSASAPKVAPQALVAPAPSSNRKVQRAAELTLTPTPDAFQDTTDGVVRETQAAGGYVQQSNVSSGDGGDAQFSLRIPTARLDATLARLSKLAHVETLNQASTDITSAFASAAGQLSDARAERAALLRALGKATTDRQIASLRARLADNRSEIAQRESALNAQRRRADVATVAVTVRGTGTAAKKDDGAWTPRDALHDAGRVLEVAGGVALIALAVLAPLAILAALALLAARVLRRRRREGALDAAR